MVSSDGIETLRIVREFGRWVLRSGLKGRRNPAQGASLGASNALSTRGLSGRRRESLGASKVSSTRAVTGRKNPLAPVATPVTIRNFAWDLDQPPAALEAGGLWPVAET